MARIVVISGSPDRRPINHQLRHERVIDVHRANDGAVFVAKRQDLLNDGIPVGHEHRNCRAQTILIVATATLALPEQIDGVQQIITADVPCDHLLRREVHLAFNGPNGDQDPVAKGLITVDGVHPNDNGHKAIADALCALGYGPLK